MTRHVHLAVANGRQEGGNGRWPQPGGHETERLCYNTNTPQFLSPSTPYLDRPPQAGRSF